MANKLLWEVYEHENQHLVLYWISLEKRYPELSCFTIDMLSIPASSTDYERLFSEVGDLLELKYRKLRSQLLAAL